MSETEIDSVLATLEFNGAHNPEMDTLTAVVMRRSALAIRQLRSDRDYSRRSGRIEESRSRACNAQSLILERRIKELQALLSEAEPPQ